MIIQERVQELLDFEEVYDKWSNLVVYTDLLAEPAKLTALKQMLIPSNALKPFIDERFEWQVAEATKRKKHERAIAFVHETLRKIESFFSDDDANMKTARILLYGKLGVIYEKWATLGKLADYSFEDEERRLNYLCAARWYMLANLELGYISDYGLQVVVCFANAQCPDLRLAATRKIFGDREVFMVEDALLFQDLVRRTKKAVKSGNGIIQIFCDLPNPTNN